MGCCENREEFQENDQQLLLKLKEPTFHIQNKGFIEKLFGGLIQTINCDLTKAEISAFRDLQAEYISENDNGIIRFDQENEQHNQYITSLYFLLTEKTIKAQEIDNDCWIQYGFQQKNPRTDFRGSGMPGAKHLLTFVENNKDLVKQMTNSQNNFFMAISSIKVSDFLMKYFMIPRDLKSQEFRKNGASRKAFKNFSRILNSNYMGFYDLHGLVLKHLFLNHCHLMKTNTQQQFLTISDQQRFQATQNQFTNTLESQNFNDFTQFEASFWGQQQCLQLKEKKNQ